MVTEIRQAFRKSVFPGFVRFIASLSKVEGVPAAWAALMRVSRGIYLPIYPKTCEQYVGSATGGDGFHGNWLSSYARDGHSGKVGLKSRDPSDYQVSILEVAGSAASIDEIPAVETLWKRKLQSREMSLNRN